MRQSFYFLTDSDVRLEFHIEGLTLTTLHNPPRDPRCESFETAEAMADEIEQTVLFHLDDCGARLTRIRCRHDAEPITIAHLGRYGAPILEQT